MKKLINILIVHLLVLMGVKTCLAQDTVFIKSYGNIGYTYGQRIIPADTNGFFLFGNRSGLAGNTDLYMARINYRGQLIRDKAIGSDKLEYISDAIRISSNSFVLAGYTNNTSNINDYNMMLVKIDTTGNILWQKSYGGSNWDFGHAAIMTPDSGFLIAGETFSYGNGNNDIFIIRADKNGDSIGSATMGGISNEAAYDLINTSDNNFVIAGYTSSYGKGNKEAYLIKFNLALDTLWTATLGDSLDDFANTCVSSKDHGIVAVGATRNFGAIAEDALVYKLDSNGVFKWLRIYGDWGNEEFTGIDTNHSNGFMLTGYTQSWGYAGTKDFYMFVADQNGNFVNSTTFGDDDEDYANYCIATRDKGFAIIGSTESMGLGLSNALLVKTDSLGNSAPSTYEHFSVLPEQNSSAYRVYPNPFTDKLYIEKDNQEITTIWITDALGKTLLSIHSHSVKTELDLSSLNAGLYFITIQSTAAIKTQTLIRR